MTYTLPCECGRSVAATAGQAGTTLPCPCGRAVSVPTFGELRARVPPTARRAEKDRTPFSVIGFVLVSVAQVLGYLALPLALHGGGTDHHQAVGLIALSAGAVLLQTGGVLLWVIGKRQPLWLALALAPLGFVAAIVLLFTPTAEG